ncbi:putrescine ABC transporter permease PotH [Rhodospirillum rubrum]|uniref:ABC transporter permease subunit n=1 Tax=Rhodospirillum rubrum TaxID=1085 RepID=UPI0019085291|nr:ABC transporter permease subunit [Rhodospirillum rubrum]MBK1664691.1 putrescine ABC transporter permease PotH [Rhodospirillum rubrum]MBK1676553.1 putrescine ABC transporter permease PotH [Rhodospirillum rubrum]
MTADPALAPASRPPEILPGMAPWRMWLDAQIRRNGRRLVILVPYVWLLLFFVLPFAIVLKISFAEFRIGVPPYTALIEFTQDAYLRLTLALSNYKYMLDDEMYVIAYLNSLRIAGISTVLALLIGYPMAYGIARAPKGPRTILLFLVILPFWTSFLIRVYAWMGILKGNGLLNNFLIWTGVIDQPLIIMGTEWAVFIGIVYSYLPFMVLPLYATLEKLDPSLLEAAHDLGCRPWKAFLTITLPLSVPGIIAGSMLVFIPSVGEFVIPELLGGADTFMIGRVLWNEFFLNRDWPVASAVAVAMLLMLVVPIMIFQNIQAKQAEAAEERS